MLKRAIVIVQQHLKNLGHYAGNPDGLAYPATDAAVLTALTARQAELPDNALGLPPERRLVMMLQIICKDKNIEADPIDGYLGPVTQYAYESLVHLMDTGAPLPNWRDDEPSAANPHGWPRDLAAGQARSAARLHP